VFALGCVLAELFMDGQPLFDYSRLLAYRQGSTASDALAPLSKVHPSVRGMVAHMLQRDPAARHSAAQYLQDAAAAALPPWLAATVHPLHAAMLLLDADARVALAARRYPDVKAQLLGSQGGDAGTAGAGMAPADPAPQQPASEQAGLPAGDSRSGQSRARGAGVLLPDAQAALRRLEGRGSSGSTPPITPRLTSSTAEHERQPGPAAQQAGRPPDGGGQGSGAQPPPPAQHEGMVLVAVLLCSLLRGSRLQGHKARLVGLLSDAAAHCDDDTRLQRLLPYLVAATAEPLAAVKAVALRGVVRVLEQVGREREGGGGRAPPLLLACPRTPPMAGRSAGCCHQLLATAAGVPPGLRAPPR
jgi:phosphoinositide-3-kinase regulatory subunit 4